MTANLSGNGISSGPVRFYRTGAWQADLTLVDSGVSLTAGQAVTLELGDVLAVGTLRPGGEFGAVGTWTVVGGAGRWEARVDRRFYDDAAGVLLSRVVRDLAQDAGEIRAVLNIPDRSLGARWERPAGLARDMLDALSGGEWWIATDRILPVTREVEHLILIDGSAVLTGWTVVGPRPSSAAKVAGITAQPYDVALRRAVVSSDDESFWQLLPGASLALEGFPAPLLISSTILHVSAGQVAVELYGDKAAPELLGDLIAAKTAWARFLAAYPFTTTSAGTTPSLTPSDARSAMLPGPPSIPQWPGVPGLTATLAAGAGVAVVFLGGDAGGPVIVNYAPGVLPTSLAFDASGTIDVGAGAAFLAKAAETQSALGSLFAGVNAALAALALPLVSALPTVTTTKARGK